LSSRPIDATRILCELEERTVFAYLLDGQGLGKLVQVDRQALG
jgi:hypothetical protein